MITFTHIQDTPSSSWVITHGLNGYPACDFIVSSNGERQKIIPVSVVYNTPNQITANFATAFEGTAALVGIFKFQLDMFSNSQPEMPPAESIATEFNIALLTEDGELLEYEDVAAIVSEYDAELTTEDDEVLLYE